MHLRPHSLKIGEGQRGQGKAVVPKYHMETPPLPWPAPSSRPFGQVKTYEAKGTRRMRGHGTEEEFYIDMGTLNVEVGTTRRAKEKHDKRVGTKRPRERQRRKERKGGLH